MADDTPITIADYQTEAQKTDRSHKSSMTFPLLGLVGETGSLLSAAKKKQRDGETDIHYRQSVIEELGDVLWYLTAVAARAGIQLCDIANNSNRGYGNWATDAAPGLTFADIQVRPEVVPLSPSEAFEKVLLDLAGEVGSVMADFQAGKLTNNQAAMSGRLVAVFRMLQKAGDEAGVSLDEAARYNIDKIFDRWPDAKKYPALFDEDFSRFEQLPRQLTVDIFEREVRGQTYVFQQCNGLNIGDRLTDNAMEPDDYRFHDVFHYAYVAVLGWSPVIRSLMSLKRKSNPKVDEAQDGARAVLIEEGISTWVFGQGQRTRLFEGVIAGQLSIDLLKHVRQFAAGYEPEKSPLWLWEDAILQGFEAFRYLRKHRRARIKLDMFTRRLTVEELPLES